MSKIHNKNVTRTSIRKNTKQESIDLSRSQAPLLGKYICKVVYYFTFH